MSERFKYSIGTDIGGTFTDCTVMDQEGRLVTGKAPSTPPDFSAGFFGAVEDAAAKLDLGLDDLLAEGTTLVHATTAATNAMVQRKGARVGLITTRGHGDAILVMRGGGRAKGLDLDQALYLPGLDKPEPIVAREMIREVAERVDCKGEVLVDLDEEEVRTAIAELIEAGAETIAVAFLWSLLEPAHELRVRELVEEVAPGTFVSCSHQIAPRVGEYYRIVATVMNSYVGPLMTDYVGRIADGAARHGYARPVLFAQCIGGTVPVEEIRRKPLFTLDSGPVAGIVAANFLGRQFDFPNIITADMGGTTLDVAVIAEDSPRRRESTILDRYEMYLPMLDVQSIGAGGGSIAWLDPASATIKVGPQSAGADPGPVCYGNGGTEPTVTDANVALGIINPDRFLHGRRRLDREAACAAIERLGAEIGLGMERTAAGIIEIVDNTMAEKIRRMTVYRGHDPREFAVFAFGGAAGAHASAFSRALQVKAVVVPVGNIASVLSALGTISGDVVHVDDRSTRHVAPFSMDLLEAEFEALERQAAAHLEREGFGREEIELHRFASMKYGAQVFDVEVPLAPGDSGDELRERFEAIYEARFGKGSGYAPAGIEIIRERVHSSGRLPRPAIAAAAAGPGPARRRETRPVYWREFEGWQETPIFEAVGDPIEGPAVVELPDTTIVVRPGDRLESDAYQNLILTLDGKEAAA
ncbi:MAG: hydantoinase/oxoprolinase family protein [Actinobacteria bacterium]|nr:hydantoinase/oxoprolinase family protein [Actinomycetota bacterium]